MQSMRTLRVASTWITVASATITLGCGGPAPAAPSGPCPIGDVQQAPEMAVVVRAADGSLQEVQAGGRLPLFEPPQGGEVVFVGVRARNIDGCGLQIRAGLTDPSTARSIGVATRIIDLDLVTDGWGSPGPAAPISSFANIPACPSASASRAVNDEHYVLEVSLVDRAQRTASATLDVVPFCADAATANLCARECSAR